MAVPPRYLNPLVGYAMFQIGKGLDEEAVLAKMELAPSLPFTTDANRREAYRLATQNMLATDLATGPMYTRPLAESFGRILATEEPVGVRFVATMLDPNGGEHSVMVTINVRPDTTPEQIAALARAHLESGQYRPHTGNQYPTTFAVGGIVSIVEGGHEAPNLDLM